MKTARETIWNAVQSLFIDPATSKPLSPLITVSRNFPPMANIDPEIQPALFIVEDDEDVDQKNPFGLGKYRLSAKLFLFVNNASDQQAPGTALNPALDTVDTALYPPAGSDLQTLGGLVTHCWIDGKVIKVCGHNGPQTVAVIPITILTGV